MLEKAAMIIKKKIIDKDIKLTVKAKTENVKI